MVNQNFDGFLPGNQINPLDMFNQPNYLVPSPLALLPEISRVAKFDDFPIAVDMETGNLIDLEEEEKVPPMSYDTLKAEITQDRKRK